MSDRASQVIILAEDQRQQQFVRSCLRAAGYHHRAIRAEPLSAGSGSGEQRVREEFPRQVAACRARSHSVGTILIAMVDADQSTVEERERQFVKQLADADAVRISAAERIALLIPRRNVETWILALRGDEVDEQTDYKRRVTGEDVPSAGQRFFEMVRNPAAEVKLPSLARSVQECRRIDL